VSLTDLDQHAKYDVALEHARRLLVYGPPGVGKTHKAVMSAKHKGEPYIKITCTGGDMAAEYRGMFIPKGNVFEFFLGVLTRSWTYNNGDGCLLVLDEIDHAPEEVHSIMHAGLDDPAIAGITLPNGQDIAPGPMFRCVGTMNGAPQDLPDPLADRFEMKVAITEPSSEAMALIPEGMREVATSESASVRSSRTPSSASGLATRSPRSSRSGTAGPTS
jgi:MoxR-like ATPase